MAIPELTRVFGQYGLYIRPSPEISTDLSGNMIGRVVCLHRQGRALAGQLLCEDGHLPIGNHSLSMVYALFAFETSPDPEGLMQEIARSLKPEGVALVLSVNPWCLARLRWLAGLGRGMPAAKVEQWARNAGLDPVRRQHIGPFWPRAEAAIHAQGGSGLIDELRVANLVVLKRREAGLTPLRKAHAAVSLRPGMSAG
jgi:SAM-dependent methyltransferase